MLRFRPEPLFTVFFIGALSLLIVMMVPRTGLAHRTTIFAWVDGPMVHTQSRFAGGRVVKNGRISVYDLQGNLLLTGQTDSAGEFDFNLPDSTGARIVLDAGMGHGNEWVLTAQDMHSESPKETKLTESPSQNEKDVQAAQKNNPVATPLCLKRDEIKAIIDESIDNKLKPIMKSLANLHEDKPSFKDIISGIGYILGLVGVGAYVHSRKKR